MLRLLITVLFLSSCSYGTLKSGGKETYAYDSKRDYSLLDLGKLSNSVVETSRREPPVGKLDELFSKNNSGIRKVSIIVFETAIQPTRSGLSNADKVFLSAQGKQLLTEKLFSIWDESFPLMSSEIEYTPSVKVISAETLKRHGSEQKDFINASRNRIAPDDIFYLDEGKKTASETILNPRGMRDLSLLLIPATELMHGPKFSEHHKHYVNEICRELNLDAAIIVMSDLSWTSSRVDKRSGEITSEEFKLKITSSTLIPMSQYHHRLKLLGKSERPEYTLAYRTYNSSLRVPFLFSSEKSGLDFKQIEEDLLNPLIKAYKDLSQMMIFKITEDIRLTH